MGFRDSFSTFAKHTAKATGSPFTFSVAVVVILAWAVTGPLFQFSDTWQLVINTGTTIVTFLMVFLIQNTQNRDAAAMQIKLDELVRSVHGAHNRVVNLEDLSDEELERVKLHYAALAEQARELSGRGQPDTDSPEIDDDGAPSVKVQPEAKGRAGREGKGAAA
jgi:low affinity Fe/Cu permease